MLAFVLACGAFAQTPAQRPYPRIGYAYPAGGQRGTTFEVAVGGQNLAGTAAATFSTPDIAARVLRHERPISPVELNRIREQLERLQEKRAAAQAGKAAWTPADQEQMQELRTKIANRPRRQTTPAISETVTLEVTIRGHAPPGSHELRLKTPAGTSNPLAFCIGQLTEFTEPATTATTPQVELARRGATPNAAARSEAPRVVTLPALANGQILQGQIDRVRFSGRKDQRITVLVAARALVPYLADAVPGWFQATVSLHDAAGRELAYADDFRFNPDPVLLYRLPQDGEYTLAIKDAIYRGREDFVYRLAVGELPFVTSIYPLGAAVGQVPTFDLAGWNLPSDRLTLDGTPRGPGIFLLSVRNGSLLSNPVRFALDASATPAGREPNRRLDETQTLALPQVVDGRIEAPGEVDAFRFRARAGDRIVAEVMARRLDSPLDSTLEILDAVGKRIAFNDDCEDKRSALHTHHADSRIAITAPADGVYVVRVADAQGGGGTAHAYRLHLGPPRPGFDLRIVPSAINARAGAHVPFTVYALRHDGFDGEIRLGLHDPPRGMALSGARIPPGEEKVQLTLWTPPAALDTTSSLQLAGRAEIAGETVTQFAVPAEDMMQAFAYRHLVPAKELIVHVSGRAVPARLTSSLPVRLVAGSETAVRFALAGARNVRISRVDSSDPPVGVSVAALRQVGDEWEIRLAYAADAKPAARGGNLILDVYGERSASRNDKKAKGPARPFHVATLPAIPFVVPETSGM